MIKFWNYNSPNVIVRSVRRENISAKAGDCLPNRRFSVRVRKDGTQYKKPPHLRGLDYLSERFLCFTDHFVVIRLLTKDGQIIDISQPAIAVNDEDRAAKIASFFY